MNLRQALGLAMLVCTSTVPLCAKAQPPAPTSLVFHEFPDAYPIYKALHRVGYEALGKEAHRLAADMKGTDPESRLQRLFVEALYTVPGGYIPLSDTEFLVRCIDLPRVEQGFYLADLATWTISRKAVSGPAEIVSTLQDKKGHEYLLLRTVYSAHDGAGGTEYSLLTTRTSGAPRPTVLFTTLEGASWDAESGGPPRRRDGKCIGDNFELAAKVQDVDADGFPDVSITSQHIDCGTASPVTKVTNYYAASGFASHPEATSADLLKAEARAVSTFTSTRNSREAASMLEKAGVHAILFDQPADMATAAYASILNNYAFLIAQDAERESLALPLLERVIELQPARTVAYLNRAEVRYNNLLYGELRTQAEKVEAAMQIMNDYRKYRDLGGNTVDWLEQFAAFNLAAYPADLDVCAYVQRYIAAGSKPGARRIDEIRLGTRRLDIDNDGVVDQLVTESEKFGYETYSAVSIVGADGASRQFSGAFPTLPADPNHGFTLFAFEGRTYFLLPHDDVGLVEGGNERIVCEAKREQSITGQADMWLRSVESAGAASRAP